MCECVSNGFSVNPAQDWDVALHHLSAVAIFRVKPVGATSGPVAFLSRFAIAFHVATSGPVTFPITFHEEACSIPVAWPAFHEEAWARWQHECGHQVQSMRHAQEQQLQG